MFKNMFDMQLDFSKLYLARMILFCVFLFAKLACTFFDLTGRHQSQDLETQTAPLQLGFSGLGKHPGVLKGKGAPGCPSSSRWIHSDSVGCHAVVCWEDRTHSFLDICSLWCVPHLRR